MRGVLMLDHGLGCICSPTDVRDYKLARSSVSSVELPESFECEKRSRVKDQRSVGSCVAHAASSILEYHYSPNNRLSTNFIYGIHYKLFGSEGPGVSLREACKIISKYGDPELKYCPGNTEVEKVYDLAEECFDNPEAMENASKYKIDNYVKLLSDKDIKYSIFNYGPVLAAIEWFDYNDCDFKGKLIKNGISEGYHAIIIYGWNKDGWLCQNSWGITWGKAGYFILPYDYKIRESYSFVPSSSFEELRVPKRNSFLDVFYKIINWILNFWG